MKPLRVAALGLPLVLLAPVPAASGDGCPPSSCGTTSTTVPGSRTLVVRPMGQQGPLVVYDVVTRRKRFELPSGLLSADGRRFFTTKSGPKSRVTTLERYSAVTGRRFARRTLTGRFWIVGVSPNGRRIVLAQALRKWRGVTHFRVFDGGSGRQLARIALRGSYAVETLSPDGNRIFLVHNRRTGYDLRLYDLRTRRLHATPTFEPSGDEEKMTGTPWTAVASRDGRWLLTLYLKPALGTGFVHALDLRAGRGHCVDLPVERVNAMALGTSALALSPDERRLYVAAPFLGRVFTIDLRAPRVVRTAYFAPHPLRGYTFGVGPSVAVSANGGVAFSGDRQVWRFSPPTNLVGGPHRARGLVTGIAFGRDGRLLVLRNGVLAPLR